MAVTTVVLAVGVAALLLVLIGIILDERRR